jgi:uncharacterized protein
MRDFRDAKVMAQTLREELAAKNISITHSECLELVAKEFGWADWNTLSAKIQAGDITLPTRVPNTSAARNSIPQPLRSGMRFPLVPLRDIVIFPEMISSLLMGREKSIRAVEHAAGAHGRLLVVAQRNPADENPADSELYQMGVVANVLQCTKAPNGNMLTWVQGEHRATILSMISNAEFKEAEIAPVATDRADPQQTRALAHAVRDQFVTYVKARFPARSAMLVPPQNIDPGSLADTMASSLPIEIREKQELLETNSVVRRLEKIREILMQNRATA